MSGTASSFERERLERWRREDSSHESRFQELSSLWDATHLDGASETEDTVLELRAEAVVAEAERRRASAEGEAKQESYPRGSTYPASKYPASKRASRVAGLPRRILFGWRGAAALAAGLAALAIGFRSFSHAPLPPVAPPDPGPATLEPARALDLPDGSVALLAPGARLEIEMAAGIRRVALQGRAFFAVVPDATRPFVVRVGDSEVRVLGTRFEVGEGEDGVRAVVVEGRVRLASSRGEVEVPVGSVGLSSAAAPPSAHSVEDVLGLLAWPGGALVFRGTPLGAVAREVGRHFGARIEIRGPSLRERGISAHFREESFAEVVETLCAVAGARCSEEGDVLVMEEKEDLRP